jgi:hypothetical protein
MFVVVVGPQDERRDLRVAGPDLTADVDPGAVGQAAVEDGHVGPQRGDPTGRLLGQPRLADDLDVPLARDLGPGRTLVTSDMDRSVLFAEGTGAEAWDHRRTRRSHVIAVDRRRDQRPPRLA